MDPPETLDGEKIKERSALEQKQRALEREIRRAKRKVNGLSDPENIRKAKAELKTAQKKLKDFIDTVNTEEGITVLKRNNGKENVYGGELTKSDNGDIIKETEGGLIITKSQFGKKVGKHAVEFGLDPTDKESRDKVLDIIADIHDNPDLVVDGLWRGQGELNESGAGRKSGKVMFFIKGVSVVVSKDNQFVTVMGNGLNNGNVKKALESHRKEAEQ